MRMILPAPIPRTVGEILRRIESVTPKDDGFGVERSRYVDALPDDQAAQFMPDLTAETPRPSRLLSLGHVRMAAQSYYTFAWSAANDRRMISAMRALAHYRGLVWLAGDEELLHRINWLADLTSVFGRMADVNSTRHRPPKEGVAYYGKAAFAALAPFAGRENWAALDDGRWFFAQDTEAEAYPPQTAQDVLGILQA